MLLALIGFMPTDGLGSIGSLDCPAEERRRLARRYSLSLPVFLVAYSAQLLFAMMQFVGLGVSNVWLCGSLCSL